MGSGAERTSPNLGYSLLYKTWGRAKELKNVGLFTNHGTIGAATKDTMLSIEGDTKTPAGTSYAVSGMMSAEN